MDYQIRYRAIRDDRILCEVVQLDDKRRSTGPVVVKGTGNTKEEARRAALSASRDPAIRAALEAASAVS